MKMKTKRKALLLSLCAVLLVVASVMGTMAYLTDSAEVKNTFSVGKVKIDLDEADVNEYGEKLYKDEEKTILADRVKVNDYLLVPGKEYVKDPIVYVTAGSEDSWIFVKVENGIAGFETGTTIADQITANGWAALDGQAGVYYKAYTKNTTEKVQYPVFGKFTIADTATWTDTTTAEVKVTAYAIQKAGFDTPAAAWTEVSK